MRDGSVHFWRRVAAYLIDHLLFFLPLLIGMVIVLSMGLGAGLITKRFTYLLAINAFVLLIPFIILKDTLCGDRSFGKRMMGLAIEATKGKIALGRIVLRNVLQVIPLVNIIDACMLVSGKRIGDMLADTTVVKKERNRLAFSVPMICFIAYALLVVSGCIGIAMAEHAAFERGFGNTFMLEPERTLSSEELVTAAGALERRLAVAGILSRASAVDGRVLLDVHDTSLSAFTSYESLLGNERFTAWIGETTIITGSEDVLSVCRTPECSSIEQCDQTDGGYICRFQFTIHLSSDAAERQARATDELGISYEQGIAYLDDPFTMYLGDSMVDSLRISPELKGMPVQDIMISGSGVGSTMEEARDDAVRNMRILQTILSSEPLPAAFSVVG